MKPQNKSETTNRSATVAAQPKDHAGRRTFLAASAASLAGYLLANSAQGSALGNFDIDQLSLRRRGLLLQDKGYLSGQNLNFSSASPLVRHSALGDAKNALSIMERQSASGGWMFVPDNRVLKIGDTGQNVAKLRERLLQTADMHDGTATSRTFDSQVEEGVKHFQKRHGLTKDGIVDFTTLQALNTPIEKRMVQLGFNLDRIGALPQRLRERYVTVNLTSAEIEAVENDAVVHRYGAVAGNPKFQSPILTAQIKQINFNPFWTIPKSVIKRSIIPKLKRNVNYAAQKRIRIQDWYGNDVDLNTFDLDDEKFLDYRFRQDPFEGNSLGVVKIDMPNVHAVYLHDTPEKTLFGNGYRFHSSGCVRVSAIDHLVTWLLEPTGEWDYDKIAQTMLNGQQIQQKLATFVPTYWIYLTAWTTAEGVTNFRPDIYGKHKIPINPVSLT